MADLLRSGLAWLEQQRTAHLTSEVTYQHGASSLVVQATVGRSEFELIDSSGVVLRIQTRDYLISAASINLEPKPGHRIVDDGVTYEVSEFGSEPAWRWSDPYRQTYRIHCKQVRP